MVGGPVGLGRCETARSVSSLHVSISSSSAWHSGRKGPRRFSPSIPALRYSHLHLFRRAAHRLVSSHRRARSMDAQTDELSGLAGKRVLICEDEGITIMQLSRAVTFAGLTVVAITASAKEAVEIALRDRP